MFAFTKSRFLIVLVGLIVSVVAAWLAMRGTDIDRVSDGLSNVSWPLLVFAGVAVLVASAFRGLRWGVLLGAQRRPAFRSLYSAIMIGYLANLALPLRAGDVVRLAVIRKSSGLAPAPATASIIAERLLDIVTLAIVLGAVSIGVALPGYLWPLIAAVTVGSFVLLIGMIGAGAFNRRLRRQIVGRGRRSKSRSTRLVYTLLTMFVRGLEPMADRRVLIQSLVLSFLVRLAEVVSVVFAVAAVGIDFTFQASALYNSVVTFSMLIPSGPGAIGSFELMSVVVFSIYEIDRSLALAGAVVFHGMGIAVTVIVGTPMLLRSFVFSKNRGTLSLRQMLTEAGEDEVVSGESRDEIVI